MSQGKVFETVFISNIIDKLFYTVVIATKIFNNTLYNKVYFTNAISYKNNYGIINRLFYKTVK